MHTAPRYRDPIDRTLSPYDRYEAAGYEAIDIIDITRPEGGKPEKLSGRQEMDRTLGEAALWFGSGYVISVQASPELAKECGLEPSRSLWAVMAHEAGAKRMLGGRAA